MYFLLGLINNHEIRIDHLLNCNGYINKELSLIEVLIVSLYLLVIVLFNSLNSHLTMIKIFNVFYKEVSVMLMPLEEDSLDLRIICSTGFILARFFGHIELLEFVRHELIEGRIIELVKHVQFIIDGQVDLEEVA